MKRFSILMILFTAILISCNDDDPKPDPPKDDEIVNAIVVDKDNNKWIATNQGLYKGTDDNFSLIESTKETSISFLFYEESENMLWVGTKTGLSKVNLSSGDYTEEPIDNGLLSSPAVNDLCVDNNNKKWFGTKLGFTLNFADTWKKESFGVNLEGTLYNLAIEDFEINSVANYNGDYFFATSGAKLYRLYNYDEDVDAFTGASQWDPPYNGPAITDTMFVVFIDKDGVKWMGGNGGIQTHIGDDPKDMQAFNYFFDELPNTSIMAINQAADGKIWVGTRNGLTIYDGSSWATVNDELPSQYITAIAFDNDGSAWIGTKKGYVNIK